MAYWSACDGTAARLLVPTRTNADHACAEMACATAHPYSAHHAPHRATVAATQVCRL